MLKNIRINWDAFDWNTSEREAVSMFADGEISFKTFLSYCYSEHTLPELAKLRRLGAKAAKRRALRAVNRKWVIRTRWT